MKFLGSAVTDIGNVKETNQDSLCVKVAQTINHGQIAMVMICDGMGGLAMGEVASASVIQAFSQWFEKEVPNELMHFSWEKVKSRWEIIIKEQNTKLMEFGKTKGISLGTTLTLIFCLEDQYLIGHVGDSRAYKITTSLEQLTKDHTYIAREIAAGNMTEEQALTDPHRNMLLQCVGASKVVKPDFYQGRLEKNQVYMLCSDGFRHVLSKDEMYEYLKADQCMSQEQMENNSNYLIRLVKQRQERDNISVALLRTF